MEEDSITKAIKSSEQCLAVALETNNTTNQKFAYLGLAAAYEAMDDIPQAINCCEEWLKIATEDDKQMKWNIYRTLGHAYQKLNSSQQAIKCYKNCLEVAEQLQDQEMERKTYAALGYFYSTQANFQKAIDYYGKVLELANKLGDKNSATEAYCDLGRLYYMFGHHGDAIKSFKQCLAVALETNNTRYQSTAYLNMAAAYRAISDAPPVINCYQKWLKIDTKHDQQKKCEVYDLLGDAYQELYSSQQAIDCYEKSLEIAKTLQDRPAGQRMEQQAYSSLANVYVAYSNFQKAIDYCRKALELAITLNDKNNEAVVYRKLGEVYGLIKDYTMAIDFSEKALAIAVTVGDKNVEVSALKSLGDVYHNQGDYDKALRYIERSLQISTDIGLKSGQALAYNILGTVHRSSGNYYEAVKNQTKALEMWVEIDNKQGVANTHISMGTLYDSLGQHHEAITHYKESQEISKQIQDRSAEGRAIGGLGSCFFNMEKHEEAVSRFEESLEIALEMNDRHSEQTAYINLVKCKTLLGQYTEALEMVDKQIRFAEEMEDKYLKSTGYVSKGDVYFRLRDYEQAIDCFEKGLEIARETGNKREEANSYQALGRLYSILLLSFHENNGDQEKREEYFAKTIHYFRESLRCKEWLFDHLQEQDHLKISILETFIIDYNALTNVLLFKNEHKEALLVSERGRARALNDLLVSKYSLNQDNQPGRDPISYAEIESMASNCSILFYSHLLKYQCTWIIGSDDSSPVILGTDEAGLSDMVNGAYNTLKVREVQCEDRSVETDEVQEKQNLSVPQKSGAMDVTQKLLLSSYEKVKERCIWEEDLYDDDNPNPLEGLYKALISPVLHLLTKDEIIIIPDGVLFTVPFATLRDPNTGEFLTETKRIRLAPSLTSLKALQECPTDFHSKTGALIIGNPQVGKVLFKGKTKNIDDLQGAELEAKMVGELLGVTPFIGSQATKEAIKQNLREGVAVIHFAAHGTTDGEIFLTPSTTGDLPSEQDYILTMKEIQESGVRPQLVVLSCCHSGRGEIKAEGVVGMSRAFLAAGARAVVASLWAIADEATMVFMEKFYTHLKQGESASRSLQAAMKDMREIPRYSEPQFWAPFFLIGDDVTIKMKDE